MTSLRWWPALPPLPGVPPSLLLLTPLVAFPTLALVPGASHSDAGTLHPAPGFIFDLWLDVQPPLLEHCTSLVGMLGRVGLGSTSFPGVELDSTSFIQVSAFPSVCTSLLVPTALPLVTFLTLVQPPLLPPTPGFWTPKTKESGFWKGDEISKGWRWDGSPLVFGRWRVARPHWGRASTWCEQAAGSPRWPACPPRAPGLHCSPQPPYSCEMSIKIFLWRWPWVSPKLA